MSGGSNGQAIRRWLAITLGKRKNARSVALVLTVHGQPEPLATWPLADVEATRPESLSSEIEDLADSYADDNGSIRFNLRWLDKDGAVVVGTTWRSGGADAIALDGSDEAKRAQDQRHTENLHKLHFMATKELLEQMREDKAETVGAQRDLLKLCFERIAHLEIELLEAKKRANEAESKVKEPEPAKEKSTMEVVMDMMITEGAKSLMTQNPTGGENAAAQQTSTTSTTPNEGSGGSDA